MASSESNIGWLWGRHPVEEALRADARRVSELVVLHQGQGAHIGELVRLAKKAGVRVRWTSRGELDRIAGGNFHQGLAIRTRGQTAKDLDAFLSGLNDSDKKSLVLVALDQIQDPHNMGAIARSAACLGATGLILPERRTAPISQTVVQSSAGAIEKISIFTVGNLAHALERLKDQGIWIYGADKSGKPAWKTIFNAPMVLIIGSEGHGMRQLVRERCDEVVSIPQSSRGVDSLNASCAASILLYEISRQLKVGNP